MDFIPFADARSFVERAEPWLVQSEAEHNLLIGLSHQLQGDHPYENPILLATVEEGGEIVGCVFRTPPFKLGLTRLPAEAIPLVAEGVAEIYQSLPAVMGSEGACLAFAQEWARIRNVAFATGMRMRIFALDKVIPPPDPPPGRFVTAMESDLPFVEDWTGHFLRDTGMPNHDPAGVAARMVKKGDLFLWLDPEPRSMCGLSGPTPNGVRVGYVYTPPEFRGRGYASVAVAELSRRQLDSGRDFCFLYTDLANPISNQIYRRIGYRPVADVVDVNFTRVDNG